GAEDRLRGGPVDARASSDISITMNTRAELLATRHGPIAATSAGNGPPLFLLPANGHDARDFDAVRGVLSSSFETLALDWPGLGASRALPRPDIATATLLVDVLKDAVRAADRGPAILVGHSVGGIAAAKLAARRPDAVRALVLVDAAGFRPKNVFETT